MDLSRAETFTFEPRSKEASGSRADFLKIVEREVKAFPKTALITKVFNQKISMTDYHRILISIYHQSKSSPLTFALAATSCQNSHWELQSYLLKHADEEKMHWQWALSDLSKTQYSGISPEKAFPSPKTSAYIAFNYFVSTYMPAARLGIAMMLESLGGNYGKRIAETLMKALSLKPDQLMFAFGHGDTDVEHAQEIMQVLDRAGLSESDWAFMAYAAETAGFLYREIYEDF